MYFLAAAARAGAGSRTGGVDLPLVPQRTDHSAQTFSCATPCQLASVTNGGTYDASRVTPVLEQLCPCSLPDHPFLLDIGMAAAQSRPDIVNWLRGNHPTWRILGYDPKPSNCRSIKPVIDRADPSGNRSRFSCAAVSDRKGVFELAESDGAEGSQLKDDPAALGQIWSDGGQTFNAGARTRVPVVTLDDEVPGDAAVWMLKADVQGHEMQVLRGARKLLRERRVAWMVLELDVFALKAASAPGRPSSGSELLGFLEKCAAGRAACVTCVRSYRCTPVAHSRHARPTRPLVHQYTNIHTLHKSHQNSMSSFSQLISAVYTPRQPNARPAPSSHRHDFACINLREKTWRRAWRYKCPDERDARHFNRTCAYSDLLCGHRSVSVPPAGWRTAVESEFCEQDGWGADLCSTSKGH